MLVLIVYIHSNMQFHHQLLFPFQNTPPSTVQVLGRPMIEQRWVFLIFSLLLYAIYLDRGLVLSGRVF